MTTSLTAGVALTRAAALARISAVRPADYARSSNAIDGAVTQLPPYITHGVVTLPEVLAGVASNHRLDVRHKFVFELGWRGFFRHVWAHQGDAILQSLHAGPLPDHAYARELPADIRRASTGVRAIDVAVRRLTVQNHARMCLASYVRHLRRVHWRISADWLYGHLLDGEIASNHLSWQWVAGTGSMKPYLFNAGNVARYAPADWHSSGSVIDQSYDARRHSTRPAAAAGAGRMGLDEPGWQHRPPATLVTTPPAPSMSRAGTSGRCTVGAGRAVARPAGGLPVSRVAAVGLPRSVAVEPNALGLRWDAYSRSGAALLVRQPRRSGADAGRRLLGADLGRPAC